MKPIHNLRLLARAFWRKDRAAVLAVIGILLALVALALSIHTALKGGC